MTADEIRRFNGFGELGPNPARDFWLQEIAAQLAEINEREEERERRMPVE